MHSAAGVGDMRRVDRPSQSNRKTLGCTIQYMYIRISRIDCVFSQMLVVR